CSPGDCFTMVFEAIRLAIGFMTPVLLLSDGYLANGAEPWMIPNIADLPHISIKHPTAPEGNGNGAHFLPYKRDDRLVRQWAIPSAVQLAQRKGLKVSCAHLRYLNPMPKNTGDVLKKFKKVLIPELNCGQLRMLIRSTYLIDAVGLNKVQGRPFLVSEIEEKI